MAKAGRKSLYNPDVHIPLVSKMAFDGYTEEEMAKSIGIAEATFNRWKNEFREFWEAIKTNKEVIDHEVEQCLLNRARGYEYEETTTEVTTGFKGTTTKTVTTKKKLAPDVTAQIFWLKNRKRDEWRDNKGLEHSGEIKGGNTFIVTPQTATDDEWQAMVEQHNQSTE